jgi:amino acid transporter
MVVALAMAELASAFPTAGSLGLFVGVLLVHSALNAGSVRAVAWLNDASVTVHVVGVVALSALLLGARHHGPAMLVSGAPSASGFVRALVLGVWTFTGFDAAAHVSEETHDPARRAPFGIVSAVAVSAVAGYALVAGLTLSVGDPAPLAGQADAALSVLRASLGETVGRIAMAGICVAVWFAGLASLTGSSRMLFAFARDAGLPFAAWLHVVHPRTATPVNATATCAVAAAILVLATASREKAFLAVAALATIALYASYALPIALGAVARQRGRWRRPGSFHLGRAGIGLAWVAVAWAGFVFVVCTMANGLAAVLFIGLLVALAGLWVARVRGRFAGPKVDLAHFEERA